MGTYHTFISEPLATKEEATQAKTEIAGQLDGQDWVEVEFRNGHYIVYGVVKTLGQGIFLQAPCSIVALSNEGTISDLR